MPGPLANAFFLLAVVAVVVAHAFILRSSIRGIRGVTAGGQRVWEWVWAVLPALALVVLFVWTWNVMHPETMTFPLPAGRTLPGGVGT